MLTPDVRKSGKLTSSTPCHETLGLPYATEGQVEDRGVAKWWLVVPPNGGSGRGLLLLGGCCPARLERRRGLPSGCCGRVVGGGLTMVGCVGGAVCTGFLCGAS